MKGGNEDCSTHKDHKYYIIYAYSTIFHGQTVWYDLIYSAQQKSVQYSTTMTWHHLELFKKESRNEVSTLKWFVRIIETPTKLNRSSFIRERRSTKQQSWANTTEQPTDWLIVMTVFSSQLFRTQVESITSQWFLQTDQKWFIKYLKTWARAYLLSGRRFLTKSGWQN